MEMPKDCQYCAMAHWDLRNILSGCDAVPGKRYLQGKDDEFWKDGRPSWCPIICSLPEGHGRLVDADAYSAEMKDRQEAAWKWRNEAIAEEDELKLARAEGAFTAFTEAKLTMDKHIISPWRRVEEELPEEGQRVVAMDRNEDMEVVAYDGHGFEDSYGFYFTDVIYWMPIEPPKEVK
jgi:hypothetical protein